MIISIGREYGSGGHEIGERLAEKYDIPLYDKNILAAIAKEKGVDVESLEEFDEKPRRLLFSRRVNGFSNSMEEVLAEMVFDFLKEKANANESFVIVGRCADVVLKDYPNAVSVFICADEKDKVKRVMDKYELDKDDALHSMASHDKARSAYHNTHADTKWGEAAAYDLCINSSILGLDKTTEMIVSFIEMNNAK